MWCINLVSHLIWGFFFPYRTGTFLETLFMSCIYCLVEYCKSKHSFSVFPLILSSHPLGCWSWMCLKFQSFENSILKERYWFIENSIYLNLSTKSSFTASVNSVVDYLTQTLHSRRTKAYCVLSLIYHSDISTNGILAKMNQCAPYWKLP